MATLKTRSSTISQNSNVRLNAASTLEEPTEIPITNDISKENRNQLPPDTAELKMFVQGNKISINTKAGTTNNDISRVLSTVSEESEKYEYNCEKLVRLSDCNRAATIPPNPSRVSPVERQCLKDKLKPIVNCAETESEKEQIIGPEHPQHARCGGGGDTGIGIENWKGCCVE